MKTQVMTVHGRFMSCPHLPRMALWPQSLILLMILLGFSGELIAGEQGAGSKAESEVDSAMVIIDGHKLFLVHGISAYSAERRAREIQQRIEQIADDGSIPVDTLKIVSKSDRYEISTGKMVIMAVLDVDTAQLGIERKLVAEVYLTRIKEIIASYRRERTPEILLTHLAYVVVATLLFSLFVLVLRRSFRRLRRKVAQLVEARVGAIKIKTFEIFDAKQLQASVYGLLSAIQFVLFLLAIYVYLQMALSLLPWTRRISFALIDMVLEPLKTIANGILDYIDNVIFIIILIFFVRYFLRLLRVFFRALDSGRLSFGGFEKEWSWPTYRLVRILVIAFALVVAYPYIPGSDSGAFKGISLFLGVLFSLGSSSFVSNYIAGYTMTYRRAFKLGDRIKIGDIVGDVDEIRLLVTHLRTAKNEEVIIPNSTILNTEVTNYSSMANENGLILHTTVGIGYEVPWRQVEAMLLQAATKTAGLLIEPKPFVLQKSLGDFAVIYELNVYCNNAQESIRLYSALHANIQDVFNEYGVQIMTPAYESDTAQPKIVPKDQWYSPPAEAPVE